MIHSIIILCLIQNSYSSPCLGDCIGDPDAVAGVCRPGLLAMHCKLFDPPGSCEVCCKGLQGFSAKAWLQNEAVSSSPVIQCQSCFPSPTLSFSLAETDMLACVSH